MTDEKDLNIENTDSADTEETVKQENESKDAPDISDESKEVTAEKSPDEDATKQEEGSEENITVAESDSDDDGNYKWYAVRIISGHEKKVKTYLDSEISLENLSHKIKNVLLPLEKVFEVKSGKKKVKLKNFLPGYILIEAVLDDEVRNFVSRAPSIINIMGTKNVKAGRLDPIPLRDSEVKRIKSILNEESQSEKIDFKLSVGDPIKVTSGPFNNFNGNVLEINMEKMKVKVMVSIFGRKTPIELEFTQVEREK